LIKIPNLYWEWFHHLNYRLSPLSILSHIDCLIHQFLVLMKEHFAPQVNSDGVTFCSPNLGCNGLKRLEEKKKKKGNDNLLPLPFSQHRHHKKRRRHYYHHLLCSKTTKKGNSRTPELLDRLNYESKGENNERISN